jgi:hypothetical protein
MACAWPTSKVCHRALVSEYVECYYYPPPWFHGCARMYIISFVSTLQHPPDVTCKPIPN